MRQECLAAISAVTGKNVKPEDGDAIMSNMRQIMGALRRSDPDAWAKLPNDDRVRAAAGEYIKQIKLEALKRKADIARQVLRQDERIREMERLSNERDLHAYSAVAEIMCGVYRRARGIQNEYLTQMLDTLQGINSHWFGFVEDAGDVRDFIREAFGEDTGNARAKAAWEAWEKTTDAMRERAIRAGAQIGKIDYGYIPQSHDLWKICKAGKDAWINEIFPLLDRERFTNDKGEMMSDDELLVLLEHSYDDIITNGVVTDDVTEIAKNLPATNAARYKKFPHRVLHFKDADSFIQYETKFGEGSLTGALKGHIGKMSNDIALLESFGPKPQATYTMLKGVADNVASQAQGTVGKIDLLKKYSDHQGLLGATVDDIWNVLIGVTSQIEINRDGVANFMAGWRNLEVAGKLGKAFISSFSDIPSYFVACRFNRLGFMDSLKFFVAAYGSDWKEYANRAGFIADSIISDFNRYAADNIGEGWTAKLANATMKASLLSAFTDATRRAMCLNMMAGMAKMLKKDWADLDAYDRARLEEGGISERDFELMQMAGTESYKGIEFITLRQLKSLNEGALNGVTQEEIDALPSKLLGFIINESEMASLGPDLITRAETTGGFKRGTIKGELYRSFFLFKSFPIAMMERHYRRAAFLGQYGNRVDQASYAAGIFVATTIFGAISLQVQNLLNGKDLQDMEVSLQNKAFWMQAFTKGGGLGFLGDWIVNGLSEDARYGAMSGLTNFAGPVVGTVVDASDLLTSMAGSAIYDKETKPGARAVRLVRSHTPFVNLWYTSAVIDRAFMNEVQDYLSPGYLQRMETKMRRGTGQGYYWGRTEMVPSRAPRVVSPPQD